MKQPDSRKSFLLESLEMRRLLSAATINIATTYQKIEGYGTHLNTDASLNDQGFRNAYRDAGFNMVRLEVGPSLYTQNNSGNLSIPIPIEADYNANISRFNFGQGGWTDLKNFIQWAKNNALEPDRFLLTGAVWSPPHWLKIGTGTLINWTNWDGTARSNYGPFFPYGVTGGNTGGGRVDPSKYTDMARWVLSFVKGYGNYVGIPVDSFSFQNEPDYEGFYNTTSYGRVAVDVNDLTKGYTTDWNIYANAFSAIVQELAVHPEITTRMIGPEIMTVASWANGNSDAVRTALANQNLIQHLDIVGAHGYEGLNESAAGWDTFYKRWDQDQKPIYVTEHSGENQNWMDTATNVGNGALGLALKIHNAFTYGNASTFEYWSFSNSTVASSLVQPANRANPTLDYKYNAMTHFSKFVRPGAFRVGATFTNGLSAIGGASSLDSLNSLNISSYFHPNDKKLSTVLVNMRNTPDTTTITLPAGLNLSTLVAYRTSGSEKFIRLADLPVVNNQVTLSVPAYSVVTLTGTANYTIGTVPTVLSPASASASPVTSSSTRLAVAAVDNGGPAGLTYTWSVLGTPPAPVTFSVNGSNAAGNTTATFTKVGTYNFRVTITDGNGNIVTSDVTTTVVPAAVITLTSGTTRIGRGDTLQFSVTQTDQFGQPSNEPVSWSVLSGGGTISSAGLYRPGALAGTVTVNAAIGSSVKSATITVLANRSTREGELASLSGTGTFNEASNGGYYGSSYINFPGSGGAAQFSSLDGGLGGTNTIGIRYALGATTSRTGRILVNGVAQNIIFQPTGAWNTWSTHNVTVTLTAGKTNTFRIESTGQDLSNVDEVYVTDTSPVVGSAASFAPSPTNSLAGTLSVVGNDDLGEPGLTYSWSVTGSPPGSVSFTGVMNTNAARTISVSVATGGTYQFQATITDAAGQSVTSSRSVILVPPPPSAATFAVNDGAAQRSMISSVSVTFDKPVSLDPGALALTPRVGSATFATAIANSSGDRRTYVLTFSGTGIVGSSLPDGTYDLLVTAAQVRDDLSQALVGGNRTFTFSRLFGDTDGNGVVGKADLFALRLAINTTSTSPNYRWYLDYNGDGLLNSVDHLAFLNRYTIATNNPVGLRDLGVPKLSTV